VRTGLDFSCVHMLNFELKQDSIYCWGDNSHQQTDTPAVDDIRFFDVGGRHTCAIHV